LTLYLFLDVGKVWRSHDKINQQSRNSNVTRWVPPLKALATACGGEGGGMIIHLDFIDKQRYDPEVL